MTAVLSILHESWLSLRAQGLFKLTMGLNLLVIVAFASIGFTDTGVSMFFGLSHADSEHVNANSPWAKLLYLGIFSAIIVNVWLAWIATGLALLSTSSIFPNFVSQGAVELTLSRPISRTKIFLSKYCGGLLFVVMQVSVFTTGAFLAAGWRVGAWDPAIFLAIPLITLFYSYLFCINVFVGIWTRSTLTALIVTLVFWFSAFSLRTAENLVTRFVYSTEIQMQRDDERIGELMHQIETAHGPAITTFETRLDEQQKSLEANRTAHEKLEAWQGPLQVARWLVPETSGTINLLKRSLEHDASATFEDLMSGELFRESPRRNRNADFEADAKVSDRENARPVWWVLGKSLGFEAVVLAAAIWLFRRKDF
ncbi:MAG: hypothetical protein MK074_07165 [Phycisphaerales bacterium]|nr:hypothetical protein [Phycisphaerales bacterium]